MKLRDLYPKLSTQEREALAKSVETQPGYLWQIATQWRGKKPSIDLIARLAAADIRLSVNELVEEFSEPEKSAEAKNDPEPSAAPAAAKHAPMRKTKPQRREGPSHPKGR